MKKTTDDDVTAICSRAGIDPSRYRSFAGGLEAPDLIAADLSAGPRVAHDGIVGRLAVPPRGAKHEPEDLNRTNSGWRALRSLFETGHASGTQDSEFSGKSLHAGSLSIFGACGGVGVTTILATVGRILSSRQERVLLVDGTAETMLPFYFGASGVIAGSCSFQPPRGTADGPLLVISRSAEDSDDSRTWQSVRHSGRSVDRILLDVWRDMIPSSRAIVMSESVCLVLLTPDLHSAVRMRSLEQMFLSQERAFGHPVCSYFLLNKFDRSLALHTDLRDWLAQQVGDRLLPFAIRRSDEVTQALAEGLTVHEYAPSSGITEDFQALADWLQASGVESHASVVAATAS